MNRALACEQKYFKMNPFISLASKLPHMHTQPCNNFVQFCVNNALRRVHFHLSCSLIDRTRNLCMCFLSACRGEKNSYIKFIRQNQNGYRSIGWIKFLRPLPWVLKTSATVFIGWLSTTRELKNLNFLRVAGLNSRNWVIETGGGRAS